jgi:hypothetical protein
MRAKSEIKLKEKFTWARAVIDARCRIFLQEFNWPWINYENHQSLTPVEEEHLVNGYAGSADNRCGVCLQFDISEGTQQPSGTGLICSASEGCQFCGMILDSFLVYRQDNLGVLLGHDDPIVLIRETLRDIVAVTARYAERIVHNGEERFVIAPKSLTVLTEGTVYL